MGEGQHKRQNRDQSAAEFEAVVDAAVDGIIVIDSQGLIEVFNRGAEQIFGYTSAEVYGRNVSMLMPPHDSDRHDGYIRNYLDGKQPRIIGIGREVRGLRKNGETFPMDLSVGDASRLGDQRFVGLVRDISERRLTELALADSELRHRTLFNRAPLGIFTADLAGRFLTANDVLAALLGFEEVDWVTRHNCQSLTAPDSRMLQHNAFQSLIESDGNASTNQRLNWLKHDGETIVVDLHLTLVKQDQHDAFFIGHVTDRTSEIRAAVTLQRAQQKLAQSGRVATLGEMASAIAHEINQPLTAISTYAQACQRLLSGNAPDSDTLRDALDAVYRESMRASEVVRRIRGFVRDRESTRFREDINAIIRDSVELAAFEATQSQVEIELELAGSLPQVTVDRVQIQQVCLNLIRNAIDALLLSPASERGILIISGTTANGVEISVADNGSGVDEKHRGTLFEPFLTTKDDGMGLGLSLSQSIVVSHGGTLTYAPRDSGGSIFTFELPAGQAADV